MMAGLRPAAAELLTWPFDAMRAQYANAVRAGLIERSILASRDFEVAVAQLERQTVQQRIDELLDKQRGSGLDDTDKYELRALLQTRHAPAR